MADLVWDFPKKLKEPGNVASDFAILVLNQPINHEPNFIKSFWSKACIRGLADGGSNRWLSYLENHPSYSFTSPDFISGDFDSITSKTRAYFESKKVTFIPTPDQDATDFSKALKCIQDISQKKNIKLKWVLVLCENSGRFDQIIGNINTLLRSNTLIGNVPVVIVAKTNVTWILRPGKNTILVSEDFVKEQYSCGIIPLCGPTKITTSGLKWNLDKQVSVMGELVSTSNTYLAQKLEITCDRDTVYTTEFCKSDD